MDAKVISTAESPIRLGTKSRACSGRTLAEKAAHIFRRNKRDIIIRLDVACCTVGATLPRMEPAERAKDWRPRRIVRSAAAGKRVHVLDAVVHHEAFGRSGAKEAQCHAYN
ncbi:MAG TPA: hypothetical protein VIZ90_20735 [Rhizobiaceae bacterium]